MLREAGKDQQEQAVVLIGQGHIFSLLGHFIDVNLHEILLALRWTQGKDSQPGTTT